jgi:hypothetical protein
MRSERSQEWPGVPPIHLSQNRRSNTSSTHRYHGQESEFSPSPKTTNSDWPKKAAMGSGSSALRNDQQKLLQQEILRQKQLPVDCEDISNLLQAKNEIKRIREICHQLLPDDKPHKSVKLSPSAEMTLALHREIKLKITERFDNLQDAFLSVDTNRDGFISRQEFKEVRAFALCSMSSLSLGLLEMVSPC